MTTYRAGTDLMRAMIPSPSQRSSDPMVWNIHPFPQRSQPGRPRAKSTTPGRCHASGETPPRGPKVALFQGEGPAVTGK
jgi:hypothetical protein